MPDREKVKKGIECCECPTEKGFVCECSDCPYYCGSSIKCRVMLKIDTLALLKEQEAINVDAFVQWCIDSHIMGDATVRGIKYWVGKFKEGR